MPSSAQPMKSRHGSGQEMIPMFLKIFKKATIIRADWFKPQFLVKWDKADIIPIPFRSILLNGEFQTSVL